MHRFHLLPILVSLLLAAGGAAAQQDSRATGIAEDTPRVVRIAFADRSAADELANRIDVWRIYTDEGYLVALVTPEEAGRLRAEGFVLEHDEAETRSIQRISARLRARADVQTRTIPGFPCYRTVEETYAAAEAMAAAHPDLATWIDIGDSWEKTRDPQAGWDLFVLKLTRSAVPGPKPVLFADFALHARELATAEIGTRFAEMLVEGYGIDPDVTWLLDHHEIHLLLQANPDGRERAEAGSLWRKNTNNGYCSNTSSRGADLNRNFEFEWACCGGASANQCSSAFRGPLAASEPEIQALQDYARSIFPDQRGPALSDPAPPDATGVAIDVHSFGEVVLWPWAFTFDDTGNGDAFATLGRKLAFFNGFTPLQTRDFALADGDSVDFFYGELGVAGLAYEVGTEFFEDCSSFESNVLPEMLDSLFYAARVARTPFLTPAGPEALNATATPASVDAGELTTLRATVDDTRFNHSNGTEPTQTIAAAEAFVDVPPWDDDAVAIPMVAADGTFDEGAETVEATIDTGGLAAGRHLLFLRGVDAAGNEGVVAAAFLDVAEPAPPPPPVGSCLFTEDFGGGPGGFSFADDPQNPAYTSGSASGGNLSVAVGGVDDADVEDMVGSWDIPCELGSPTDVEITLVGNLTQAANYESNETSELRLTVNGSTDVLASFSGDGNGGAAQTTGLQTFTVQATLPAGESTLALGCFNDRKTLADERTDCLFDRVTVEEATTTPPGDCAVDDDFESGAAGWANDPASTCSTGVYTLGTPTEVTNGGVTTQVGGASSGVNAIFTAVNSGAGTDDVDGGNCILSSPAFPVPSASTLSVAYFHGQRDAGDDPSGDFFSLEVSTDGGSTFAPITSHGDATSSASWATATTPIPAGSSVVLRLQCSDGAGPGDLVECGIDDLAICAD